jgi:SAM-dependent methyltransferase
MEEIGSVTDEGERSARQYGAMAAEYAAYNADSSFNAHYERPATIELLGDVRGLTVLDAGCGAGLLTKWLVDQGAVVTAFDVTPELAELARERVGDGARVLVADLAGPLPFAETGSFDLVVASLVLHYVRDWAGVLGEFRRVLRPTGAVVFSTHHPSMDWRLHSPEDYFAVKRVTETFKGAGELEVTFWRRPLTAMTEAIGSAGFVIERLVEPPARPELAEHDPVAYAKISTAPRFLFFRLRQAAKN